MEHEKNRWTERTCFFSGDLQFILFFGAITLIIHFLTFSNFGLHRDAYLYYAQSEHLSWGYWSVPPLTSLVGKVATLIFGNTVFGMRFFPSLVATANIIIVGLVVKELGGRKAAIALACLAYLMSPAYLHTDFLFQPVCFDHLFWLLSGYLLLVMIKRNNPAMWLWLGVVFGLGFLNKYSIVFFYTALGLSLLISPHRILYKSKYFLPALAIGFVIILPNLAWQYLNNWPVIMHMTELHESQLVHVNLADFLSEQFMMNAQALLLWVGALLVLIFKREEKQYRLFAFIYFIIILLLMLGRGKSYYTLGAYPVLFAFGAYFTEKYLKKYLLYVFCFLVISMFGVLYLSLSFDGIPLISYEKALKKDAYRWEDGKYHDLSQDMADMTGWDEIGESVSDIYLGLGPENRNNCDIFCYHYGQAGAVMFYGKKNNLPQPICFNGSFVFWSADSLTKDYLIWVHTYEHNDINPDSLLPPRFKKVTLMKTIDNKHFREDGTRIYLCEFPTDAYRNYYKALVYDLKKIYR